MCTGAPICASVMPVMFCTMCASLLQVCRLYALLWFVYMYVEMTLSGSGLNNTRDPTAAVCRYTRNDQPMDQFTTKATPEGYHRLTCPLPPFNATSDFEG